MYSRNMKEHAKHLWKDLGKLREHRLYAKASKCEFVKSWIKFRGQQITSGGMAPMKAKLRVVPDWAQHGNAYDIQSFLGFANYYQRFVQNYAQVANPLTELAKKDIIVAVGVCTSAKHFRI